eukprot:TRINITY_DN11347_c0_g1_i1.p1 TRINITY_DN11347_c0_g1~~TRINITY_DN11347_c0_g1_i1.p1  ORF type:complete len:183 (-),score=45.78 TRINITY_DN11347_c0_g1_i1:68-616(-)
MDPFSMKPFNFKKWIDEHRDQLKPPVGATLLFTEGCFVIMVIGGPNSRIDYHINQTEEFFYQVEGDMVLKVIHNGEFKDIPIKEGEVFLLPGKVPHSPQRFANTVGLVIEKRRDEGVHDALQWYCENTSCRNLLYEESFASTSLDLGGILSVIIKKFFASEELRTCKKCGHVTQLPASAKSS